MQHEQPSSLVTTSLATSADPAGQDPYQYLESLDSPVVEQWVTAQNQRTLDAFGKGPDFDATVARLTSLYDSEDRIVSCSRCGDWGYNTWTDADHPLGLVRRTPWQAWLDRAPVWETVLDVDGLALNQQGADDEDGEEDEAPTRWTLQDFELRYPDYDRALVSLSPDGADACIVMEFDVEARCFVDGGFEIADEGQHSIGWIDRDTVYVGWDDSAAHDEPALTNAGNPRQVRKWRRGTPLDAAPVVLECAQTDISVNVWYDYLQRRHLAARATAFFRTDWFWLDEAAAQWRQYAVPPGAEIDEWMGWLFITLREDWRAGDLVHRAGCLLAIRREAFLAGRRDFDVLFTPGPRRVLDDLDFTRNWVLVAERQDSVPRLTLWRLPRGEGDEWGPQPYVLPPDSEVTMESVDAERDDTVLIHVDHFLVPPSLYYADLGEAGGGATAGWRLLAQMPPKFDVTGMSAQLRYAPAPDGVSIPYWVIGRLPEPGGAPLPCQLYGYGGFEEALDAPAYSATTGITWLERGGIYAIACIRGGGEFGPTWHQAAVREKRQVAFDDFIAVAQALVDTGVTTPRQLSISGASNGGLLTAACMVQRPDLFGAVLSDVPVLDMARFHKLLQGATWTEEYGDPDDAEALSYLLAYSPYHQVRADVAYPPVLFSASSSDDRVHPGHARKMAAKMQAQGHGNVWYLERREGGHGAGVDARTMARTAALEAGFLWREVGG
ncbi:prolyl oligopeptidase family serine peptidase [Achromobacter aloeverae]|uniref:S9 family peptidase n=1 Tax=Achromobacter aloeverae TaxID=1750518 RepID=A0A4Q1HFL1_9BURK|nr:prolyl oligopeptidase family serine peptidase [Achromobacter aloeverae]RXN84639.1 S9 family peptidase [Achromobacter aloeverae]